MKKLLLTTAVTVTALFAFAGTASAATITTTDNKMSFETKDETWQAVTNAESKITLTNGRDKIVVKEFKYNDALPTPVVKAENFAEVFQTYYSTGKEIYLLTGYAVTMEEMEDVRTIMNSMKLADHPSKKEANTDGPTVTVTPTPSTGNPTFDEIADQISYTDYKYCADGSTVKIYVLNDGRILDANGNALTPIADATLQTSSGEFVYDFDPTQMSIDDFLNGGSSDEEYDGYYDSADSGDYLEEGEYKAE